MRKKRTAADLVDERPATRRNGHYQEAPAEPEWSGDPEPSAEELPGGAGQAAGQPWRAGAQPPMPWRAFPIDALPPPLSTFTREAARALGCDPSMIALPGLACYAGLIGNSRALALKASWLVPCALWTCVVAESGSLKSPAWDHAISPAWAVQHDLFLQHEEEADSFRRQGRGGPEPVARRTLTNDVTVEKMAGLLHDNPRGLMMGRDELSGWIGSFTKYKASGAGTDLPNWLSMHRASSLAVDRKTGENPTIIVNRALVSVTGTIQPDILAAVLTNEHDHAGLTARLLFAMPPRRKKSWSEDDIPEEISREYEETGKALFKMAPASCHEGECKPHRLHLTPDAKRVWVEWFDRWAADQYAADGPRAARLAKLEEAAPRLALVHHLASEVYAGRDGLNPVGVDSLRAGIRMAEWFATEAERLAGRRQESDAEKDLRELVELLGRQDGKGLTPRDLRNMRRKRYPDIAGAKQALDGLVVAGLASWRERAPTRQGGRRTLEVVLNSHAHETTKHETPSE